MTEYDVQRLFNSSEKPSISVLTPTIPERTWMLLEARKSVLAQTYPLQDYEHLVLEDTDHEGCAKTVNRLAARAHGDWLFILADDDLMLPACLMAHIQGCRGADIVYSPPIVWGEDGAQFCGEPPNIPSASLIKAALWRSLGGYNEDLGNSEDRDFYRRAMEKDAVFSRVNGQPTWLYRFWGGNKSRHLP